MVKLKKSISILNNVKFLYFIFLLTVLNLGYFLYNKDNQSIFLFAVLCLIVYLFNQNMIIVLLFSLISINVLGLINNLNKEGFKEESESSEESTKEDAKIDSKIDSADETDDKLKINGVDEIEKKGKLSKTNYPPLETKQSKDLIGQFTNLDISKFDIKDLQNMFEKITSKNLTSDS